jgi:hypothetical protein
VEKQVDSWFRPLDGAGLVRLSRDDIVREIPVIKKVPLLNAETREPFYIEGEQLTESYVTRRYFLTRDNRWILFKRSGSGFELVEVKPSDVVQGLSESGTPIPAELESSRSPRWDANSLTLYFDEIVCRHYKRRNAPNQFALLAAFQEERWAHSIDSPFKSDWTLRDTKDKLNKGLARHSPIKFGVEEAKPIWFVTAACGR